MELLRVATEPPVGYRMTPWVRTLSSWRTLLASWLLSLAVGVALIESLALEHSQSLSTPHGHLARHGGLSILPLAAQEVASAALSADSSVYRVGSSGAGYRAQSPAQRLRIRFGSAGVRIGSGELQVGLRLREVGYGTSLQPVGEVRPSAKANRVTFMRPGSSEWYLNGPVGLEQGFTISRAPPRPPSGPLTLAIALSGDANATLDAGGRRITFSGANGASLHYGDLAATDARGRALDSHLELHAGRVFLRVDTRGARYPLRIDPLIQQGGKLVGAQEEGPGELGTSVALSADGNTALIGGGRDNGSVGATWVLVRSGSAWIQQGPKLTGGGEEGYGEFGVGVALSSDGNTALVGGPGDNKGIGAAWVFERSGSTWFQPHPKFTGNGEDGMGRFGTAVALSADDSTALIGAPLDHLMNGGAAWVFWRSGPILDGNFDSEAKLTVGEFQRVGSNFGASVALSSDGNTALVGDPDLEWEQGAAFVFTRSEPTWTQDQILYGEGEIGKDRFGASGEYHFGESVAISADGNTVLVGGPGDNYGIGAAWTFERSGLTWTQKKITGAGEVRAGSFGTSVSLSSDGNTAVIGAPGDNFVGAVWVLGRSGSTWTQEGEKLTGGEESGAGHFGSAAVLSSDGTTALFGGSSDNHYAGAAWAFVIAPPKVTTGNASNVVAGMAKLNGTVDPNGLESTAYFQYGTTTAYGQSTPGHNAGGAEGAASLAADIGGLAPGTTYHFRILAENSAGTSYGTDQMFTTAPPIPVNTVAPAISGRPIRGQALSISQGSWSNDPTSFVYHWQSCDAAGNNCVTSSGADGSVYILTQGDVGHRFRATVIAGNANGSSFAISAASPVVGSQVEATMTWTFGWSRRYTTVESLIAQEIPAGATVEVTCDGWGCPFVRGHAARVASRSRCRSRRCARKHSRSPYTQINLAPLFRRHRLGVGTHITVHILKTDWIGKSFLFTTRANRAPRYKITCLTPGSGTLGRSC
jgi:hypothetical protein